MALTQSQGSSNTQESLTCRGPGLGWAGAELGRDWLEAAATVWWEDQGGGREWEKEPGLAMGSQC